VSAHFDDRTVADDDDPVRSASRMVARRWAMTIAVRPAHEADQLPLSVASCTNYSLAVRTESLVTPARSTALIALATIP
jgi:hypothetical protein